MKIRSVTCFYNPSLKNADKVLKQFSAMLSEARQILPALGFTIQSTRLATTPLTDYFPADDPMSGIRLTEQMDAQARQLGFDYLSLGPVLISDQSGLKNIPAILAKAENSFLSSMIADHKNGICLPAIHRTAEAIVDISRIGTDGFANLRFAALANVPPFTPFFPAAYSEGDATAFAFAMQCADDVVKVFQESKNLGEARSVLLQALQRGAEKMESAARTLSRKYDLQFKGFDFSPAPYPQDWCSLGAALEALGVSRLGSSGSLAAAAFLADSLQQGQWLKTGFNGIMLPVLEDSRLAKRSAEGMLGVYDLLLYSAVCGTGLDTLPLPGDIRAKEIEPLLLDIGALALRLDKPLTARLMPIPGKRAGDETSFHFDYFANGRVLDYRTSPLRGLLAGDENFWLSSRN